MNVEGDSSKDLCHNQEVVCVKSPKQFPHITEGAKYRCEYIDQEELYYVGGMFFDKKRHKDKTLYSLRSKKSCPVFEEHFVGIGKIRKEKIEKINNNALPRDI